MTIMKITTKQHEDVLNPLLDQLDDYKNRDRCQNICIRCLPEATHAADLLPTVQGLFRQIPGDAAPDLIELDRVHRALLPVHQDTEAL